MKISRQHVVELQRGDLLPLDEARGARVRCLEGTLWITQQDDGRDIVLEAGEEVELWRDGRTVIQAMAAARAAMTPAVSAVGSSGRARPLRRLLPRAARA